MASQLQTCFVCEQKSSTIEVHHIWMQAAGGKDGPTVALCANCHAGIHRQALNLCSKAKRKAYFPPDQMARAKPLIQAIYAALLQAKEGKLENREMTIMVKLPADFVTILHSLKADAGHSNLTVFVAAVLRDFAKGKF